MNHKHLDIKVTKICMQTVSDWVDQRGSPGVQTMS